MLWPQRAALLVVAAAMLGATFELIRKRRLREEYAVLWICTGIMILVFAFLPGVLFALAEWLQLSHSVLITFLCVLFLAAIVLHYSVVLSRQSDREKALTQEMALLKDEIARLREVAGDTEGRTADEPSEPEVTEK
jgi:hypothetical protein